jgi:aminopeptidase N
MLRSLSGEVERALTAPERLSLLGDEWALVKAGRHTAAEYLSLIKGYASERVSGIVAEMSIPLGFIHDYVVEGASRAAFQQHVRTLLHPLFLELGISASPGDTDDRRTLRAAALNLVGDIGRDQDAISQARAALQKSLAAGTALDSTSASTILSISVHDGDAALFDKVLAAARTATSPADHYRYLNALTEFEDSALLARALELSLSSELRSQDTALYLAHALGNAAINHRVWAFVKQHWTELAPKVTVALSDVRLVQSLGSFCDAESREDIRSFFTARKLASASRALDQTLERIDNCIAMKQKQKPALMAWLQGHHDQ